MCFVSVICLANGATRIVLLTVCQLIVPPLGNMLQNVEDHTLLDPLPYRSTINKALLNNSQNGPKTSVASQTATLSTQTASLGEAQERLVNCGTVLLLETAKMQLLLCDEHMRPRHLRQSCIEAVSTRASCAYLLLAFGWTAKWQKGLFWAKASHTGRQAATRHCSSADGVSKRNACSSSHISTGEGLLEGCNCCSLSSLLLLQQGAAMRVMQSLLLLLLAECGREWLRLEGLSNSITTHARSLHSQAASAWHADDGPVHSIICMMFVFPLCC